MFSRLGFLMVIGLFSFSTYLCLFCPYSYPYIWESEQKIMRFSAAVIPLFLLSILKFASPSFTTCCQRGSDLLERNLWLKFSNVVLHSTSETYFLPLFFWLGSRSGRSFHDQWISLVFLSHITYTWHLFFPLQCVKQLLGTSLEFIRSEFLL